MDIIAGIRRRVLPLEGVMTGRDFRAVSRTSVMTPGATRVAGFDVAYSDKVGVLHSAK